MLLFVVLSARDSDADPEVDISDTESNPWDNRTIEAAQEELVGGLLQTLLVAEAEEDEGKSAQSSYINPFVQQFW